MFPIPPLTQIFTFSTFYSPTLLAILYTDVIGVVMYLVWVDKKREISSFQTEKKMGLFYKLMFFMKDLQKTTLCEMPCIKWSNERTGAVK